MSAPTGGRLATVSGYGSTSQFTYDTYGRVTSKSVTITGAPSAFVTAFTYDTMGRTSSITYPSGNVLGMTYNEGRIVNMTLTPSGGSSTPLISDIRYFPFGGPESWLLGPNAVTSATYLREIDLNSRIEKYSTPTGYRQLGFDDGGRITSMKNCSTTTVPCPAGNLLWTNTYGYDTVGRLTSFNGSTSNGNAQANITQSQSFTYDANGNRLTAILNGSTSTYAYPGGGTPTSNRLISVTGGLVMTNTYDNAGNLTNDGTRTFVYDSRGRMTSATNAGTTTSYLIDYRNLRVKKSNSTETRFFVYDDAGHMLGEYDANGNPVQEIFWLGDTPIAVRGNMPCLTGGTCTETGTAYVWADHLNTPRELTRVNPANNQHVSIWKWDSLPFGETTPNQNPSNLGVMSFNHRFPGQYRDSETGLYQNWHREYDARLGRYIQSDPEGLVDNSNTYLYVGNKPLTYVDPWGLFCTCAYVAALDKSALPGYRGKCATHVRKALEAGGLDTKDRPASGAAKDYGPFLEANGFTRVGLDGYQPQLGDTAVFNSYPGGSAAGHIQGYTGTGPSGWVSDTKQPNFFANRDGYGRANDYVIYRPPASDSSCGCN